MERISTVKPYGSREQDNLTRTEVEGHLFDMRREMLLDYRR